MISLLKNGDNPGAGLLRCTRHTGTLVIDHPLEDVAQEEMRAGGMDSHLCDCPFKGLRLAEQISLAEGFAQWPPEEKRAGLCKEDCCG